MTKREKDSWLEVEDLENFPSKDLCTINQLWLAASEGKFGFSVQKQILTDLAGESRKYYIDVFESFLKKVGWAENKWAENKIVFDQRAKAIKGHLPVGVYVILSDNLMINRKWWGLIDQIVKTSEEEREKREKKLEEELEKLRRQLIGRTMGETSGRRANNTVDLGRWGGFLGLVVGFGLTWLGGLGWGAGLGVVVVVVVVFWVVVRLGAVVVLWGRDLVEDIGSVETSSGVIEERPYFMFLMTREDL